MPRLILRFLRATALLLALATGLVWAAGQLVMAQTVDDPDGALTVSPVPGWRAAPGEHVAGLRFTLAPGWKTYWRRAGAAGIAPRLDWSGSAGVRSVAPAWPRPAVFRQAGDLSIGYASDFVLPLLVRTEPGPATLRGRLDLGVCAEICVPLRLEVEVALPADGTRDPVLLAALADRPRSLAARADCTTRPTPDGLALTGTVDLPPLGGPEVVVFEPEDPRLWVTDAIVARVGSRLVATSELMVAGGERVSLDRDALTITVIGASDAVELAGCAP